MKFIKPIPVTSSSLISSTIAEADYAAWSSGTTYALAARVISTTTHRIYESVQASNTNHNPTTDSGTWWIDIGPTNRWAMFDQAVGSVSTGTTSLVVELAPGIVDSLALLDVTGSSVRVLLKASSGGATVSDTTYTLGDSAELVDWFGYFFDPIVPKTSLIVNGIPPYAAGRLTVTINDSTAAKCGTLTVGKLVDIGQTMSSPSVSIVDYSKKETDAYGVTSILERTYAKRFESRFLFETKKIDYVTTQLSAVRATPCVWIGDDAGDIESLLAYGFYKDWGVNITYPAWCEASITIEGLT